MRQPELTLPPMSQTAAPYPTADQVSAGRAAWVVQLVPLRLVYTSVVE